MDVDEVLKKFGAKIEDQSTGVSETEESKNYSGEYQRFKQETIPSYSRYEKTCNSLGGIFKIKLSKKDNERTQKNLDAAHLETSPGNVVSLAIVSLILCIFVGICLFVSIVFITNTYQFTWLLMFLIGGFFLFFYLYSMPARFANKWRLKTSSQMVPAILYIVIYMKHTSNLERAIKFASEHIQPPLALDFKKIFWDVEVGKYSTIKESLEAYLEGWREYSIEFIEAFHLIESSLFEPDENRRVEILEKALTTILDGVYDRMLKYTHEIRAPLTNLYMLGIVLPTLAIALLPLASTLLGGVIKSLHVFILFNVLIPFFVFYITNEVMIKRPGGYGETELLEMNPNFAQYKNKKYYLIAFIICFPLFIIGLLPLIFQYTPLSELLNMQKDYSLSFTGISFLKDTMLFGFLPAGNGGVVGPFSPIAVLLSLLIPLSIAMFFSIANNLRTKELIKARDSSKQLEKEFIASLFQLGNRLGDGMPAEMAFGRVAESTRGLVTENFFRTVNANINQLGMSVEQAIFNPKRGAIAYYPSSIIATTMRILIESVKKGLRVAARSLMSISEYVKNIDKINERLRDLLAEIISDMKSNMTFLAPLLAGIVVGLAGMITVILNKLSVLFDQFGGSQEITGLGNISNLVTIFDITKMVPPYFLQISIGIYIVEIIFILTNTLVTVDSGEDKLRRDNQLGKNLGFGMLLYFIVAAAAIIALSLLANIAIGGAFAG